MNILDAAERTLKEAGQALSYSEITNRILASGLWSTAGKTPAATVNAALSMEIKTKGAAARFGRVSPGVYKYLPHAERSAPAPNHEHAEPPVVATAAAATGVVKGAPSPEKSATLSFIEAGERVLQKFGGGQPMHYRAITEKALQMGWLTTEGKTPESSMYAQILTDNKRRLGRGEQPRFEKLGRGFVGLARTVKKGLAFQIEEQNRKCRAELLTRLLKMSPAEFEEIVGRLLAEMGFEEILVTKISGDGGIDVRGTLVVGEVIRNRMAVQVKRWKNNVQSPTVQQVRGSLGAHEHGLIVTTSDFSKGARDEAARPDAVPVGLMDGEQLVALLVQYEIGVTRRSHDLIELGEDKEAIHD